MFDTDTAVTLRKGSDRGFADHGWLKSFHSFSFADYYDQDHMQFGSLRVINDDRIVPGSGFGMHGHKDMEIITYVLSGAVAHKDSMGNGSVIRPGDVQRMSAGRGVLHSEFNGDDNATTHLLQIWIVPNVKGIDPSYEEKRFSDVEKRGILRLIASPDGRDGSVKIHQDAQIYAGLFDGDEAASYRIPEHRKVYLHVAQGSVVVQGNELVEGDAVMIEEAGEIFVRDGHNAEVLLFDVV